MANKKTTKQVKNVPNPTGKGGFGDNPQNRGSGTWAKDQTFAYWFLKFKNMPVKEFEQWKRDNPKDRVPMAAALAYERVQQARHDLKNFQEVANRTEGMPTQRTEVTGADGGAIKVEQKLSPEQVEELKKGILSLALKVHGSSKIPKDR